MKFLAALIFPLLLISCYSDDCPEVRPQLTIEFSVRAMATDAGVADILKKTVGNIDLFLADEKANVTQGPFKLNMSEVYASAEHIVDEVPQDDMLIKCTATCKLPKGDYKMWMWANVTNPVVYSFDRFSVEQKNNIVAGDYMSTKPLFISVSTNGARIDAGTLQSRVVMVDIDVEEGLTPAVSLVVDPVCKSANADGTYSTSKTPIEYRASNGVIPMQICLFPNDSEFGATYTFRQDEVERSIERAYPSLEGRWTTLSFYRNLN